MKIKSHIRRITALAFIVLSLSFIFPAVSYAEAPIEPIDNINDTSVRDLKISKKQEQKEVNQISRKYILTNLWSEEEGDKVLARYSPGAGFSGVYNITTGRWMALPSQGASLEKNDYNNDSDTFSTVSRSGGHLSVRERFFYEMKNKYSTETVYLPQNNLGFFIQTSCDRENKTLNIGWTSGKINCCYYWNEEEKSNALAEVKVPDDKKDYILKAIKQTIKDYEVKNQIIPLKEKDCNENDKKGCFI